MLGDAVVKRRISLAADFVAVALFTLSYLYWWRQDTANLTSILTHISGDAIQFGVESGFYEHDLSIELLLNRELPSSAQIYYTLDGNDPHDGGILYNQPIQLRSDSEQVSIFPLKAAVCYKGEFSQPVERTYVVGREISFTMPVVSITCPEKSLWDDDTGIFSNASQKGEEWERQAHVMMFDLEGNTVVDQGVGLSVIGNTSRGDDRKGLRINADLQYDPQEDKLLLSVFSDGEYSSDLSFVEEYGSVKLRAGSQDYTVGVNVRQSVVSILSEQSRFDGCAQCRRCIVFLNGQYYGVMDMLQPYSQGFLADRYDLDHSECVTVLSGREATVFQESGLYDLFRQDLQDPEAREALEAAVDMDNYLLYHAFQILLNNTDWPQKNFAMWYYEGEPEEDNPYSDGRCRFLVYDMDLIYYAEGNHVFFDGYLEDTFCSIMNQEYRGADASLPYVLQVEEYRDRFIVMLCDLMNTSFRTENVLQVLDSEYSYYLNECLNWDTKTAQIVLNQPLYYRLIVEAITQRNEDVKRDILSLFQISDRQYKLNLSNDEGLLVSWNNMQVFSEESYTCEYYSDIQHQISVDEYPGFEFCYWLVNGEKIEGKTLAVDEKKQSNGQVNIRAVSRRIEEGVPVIERISANGNSDWIVVGNVGAGQLSLDEYYLSDEEENLKKYQLPSEMLAYGETVCIYCKGNYFLLDEYICNFNLNEQETLYLSDGEIIIDKLSVPKMSASESYGRYQHSPVNKFILNDETAEQTEEKEVIPPLELLVDAGYGLAGNYLAEGNGRYNLMPGVSCSQYFIAESSDCKGVILWLANYTDTNRSGLTIQFFDVQTGKLVGEGYMEHDAISDCRKSYCKIEAQFVPGQQYEMRITADRDAENCRLLLFLTDEGTATEAEFAVLDGEKSDCCISMILLYSSLGH